MPAPPQSLQTLLSRLRDSTGSVEVRGNLGRRHLDLEMILCFDRIHI